LKQKVNLPALIARGSDPETRVFAPRRTTRCSAITAASGSGARGRASRVRRARLGCVTRARRTSSGGSRRPSEPETLEGFKTRPMRRHTQGPERNVMSGLSHTRPRARREDPRVVRGLRSAPPRPPPDRGGVPCVAARRASRGPLSAAPGVRRLAAVPWMERGSAEHSRCPLTAGQFHRQRAGAERTRSPRVPQR
jgi:hypothetical protein